VVPRLKHIKSRAGKGYCDPRVPKNHPTGGTYPFIWSRDIRSEADLAGLCPKCVAILRLYINKTEAQLP
jgi:hypothetical protein